MKNIIKNTLMHKTQKQRTSIVLTLCLSLFVFTLNAQQSPCNSAHPICSDSTYNFPNVTSGTAPSGPDYGCLYTYPNPVWYYLRIAQGGVLHFDLAQNTNANGTGGGLDIDFAMYGPFTTLTGGCSQIMSGSVSPLQCSYSAAATEDIGIGDQGGYSTGQSTPAPGQPGQYYILLLTNFSGSAGYITLNQSNTSDPGAGLTDCSIINPCNYTVSVDDQINVCAGDSVDITNAFDSTNSDPSINSYYTSFTDAIDSVNQMTSTIVGAGTYYIRSNYSDTLHCFLVNVISVTPGIDNANFTLTDYCQGASNAATAIATPGGTFAFNPVPTDGATIDPATGEISNGVGGTKYYVEYTTNQGCPNTSLDSVNVKVIPKTVIPADTTICAGDSITLSATNPDNASLSWTYGVTNGGTFPPQITDPDVPDTINYIVTLSKNGCSAKDTTTVIVNPTPPGANFAALITETCVGTPVPFANYTGKDSLQTLTAAWEYGDGDTGTDYDTTYHAYSQEGTYDITLTITNEYGCTSTKVATQYIHIVDGPVAAFTANPAVTDLSNPQVVFTNTSTGATHYAWNFGDQSTGSTDENPTHSFPTDAPNVYTVTLYAMNDKSCVDSVSHPVKLIYPDPVYTIPNVFTPDGDGVNDFFKFVNYANISSLHIEILNRWGNLVFTSDKVDFKWDGMNKDSNTKCDDGTYFYKIKMKDFSGHKKTEFGYVHLIHGKK